MAAKKRSEPHKVSEPKNALETYRRQQALEAEVVLLKKRVRGLRKLRDQMVITISDPSGAILRTFTLPYFVYEKRSDAIDGLKEELSSKHNQYLETHYGEDLIQCGTLEDMQAEIDSLNEIDDQKEEDGVEG